MQTKIIIFSRLARYESTNGLFAIKANISGSNPTTVRFSENNTVIIHIITPIIFHYSIMKMKCFSRKSHFTTMETLHWAYTCLKLFKLSSKVFQNQPFNLNSWIKFTNSLTWFFIYNNNRHQNCHFFFSIIFYRFFEYCII